MTKWYAGAYKFRETYFDINVSITNYYKAALSLRSHSKSLHENEIVSDLLLTMTNFVKYTQMNLFLKVIKHTTS